jgi:hypothetical protein
MTCNVIWWLVTDVSANHTRPLHNAGNLFGYVRGIKLPQNVDISGAKFPSFVARGALLSLPRNFGTKFGADNLYFV